MKPFSFNQKLIISGFALLLFGILLALVPSFFGYISGGLGLFFVLLGCFTGES